LKQNASQEIRDIYKLDKQLVRVWKQIHSELSKKDCITIDNYDTEMVNTGLGKSTRIKHLKLLLSITRKINKEWSQVTKVDISNLVRNIMNEYGDFNGDETETSRDFKKILKLFYRWFKFGSRDYKEVGDPEETRGIKLRKPKDKLTRESLLDEDDLSKLLHACGENMRDRAFISTHYEAGTRPGEILSLQLKHVEFDDYGARISVDGKTGARKIRLVTSTPNLALWVNSHPFRTDPEAPLWILLDSDNYGKAMTYTAAKEMISRRCKSAKISKRVNLKLFRHTAATNAATFLTESAMRQRHGWTNGSNMTSRYVHLVDSDVEDKILSHYGIKKKSDDSASNAPKICVICKMPNSDNSEMCSQCGKPLDLQTALAKEEQSQKDKEEQRQKMEEMEFNLQQLQVEVGILRRGARSNDRVIRTANTILYKNQDKIPGLDMKPADKDYFLKDKDLEKNYTRIYDTDSYAFSIDKQSQRMFSNKKNHS